MKAANDYVFIRADEKVQMTPGGIVLPEGSQEEFITGIIESIGPKVEHLQIGQRVMVDKYMLSANEQVYIVKEEDVIGVETTE